MDLPNAPHHGTVQWHHQHGGDQLEQLKMQKAFGIDFLDLLPAFNWTDFFFFNLLWSLSACSYDKRYFSPPLWMTQVRDAVSKSWWTETDVRQEEGLSDYRKKSSPPPSHFSSSCASLVLGGRPVWGSFSILHLPMEKDDWQSRLMLLSNLLEVIPWSLKRIFFSLQASSVLAVGMPTIQPLMWTSFCH